jgi:DMSO/TMAO reductase YedYZ molybdopterin-dependent catalytic subunit
VAIDDALAEDLLIAERLDGRPLDGNHGAPARLVSPHHYGFVSTKHLCRIELRTAEPTGAYASPAMRFAQAPSAGEGLGAGASSISPRPVGAAHLPAPHPPIASLSAHGSRRSRTAPAPP